jgi:hypothetical protein
MEITWGVPTTTRTVKEEKFTTPVVSLVAIKASKAARKFTFNKAAKEALGLTDYCNVMLGFTEGKVVIKNLGNFDEGVDAPYGSFVVSKILTFSDKKIFEHIIKLNKLDITKEHHIHLIPVEDQPFMIQSSIEVEGQVETEDVFKDESEINKGIEVAVVEEEEEEVAQTPAPEPVKHKVIKATRPAPEVKAAPDAKRVMFAVDDTDEEEAIDSENITEEEEEEW